MESTSQAPVSQDTDTLWTARVQFLNSTIKPVKLLELGDGPKGKFARIEFADEVSRPIYLASMEDAWHPLFDALTWDDRWKIRRHQNPIAPETLPDGCVKEFNYLSFQSSTHTKRRRYIASSNFDVPAQSRCDGLVTGMSAAMEYMRALSLPNFRASLLGCVSDMAPFLNEEGDDPSRRHAAHSFINQLDEMLVFAAKNCNHQQYFQEKLLATNKAREQVKQHEEQQKTEFVERMRAAKAAKRQAAKKEALAV